MKFVDLRAKRISPGSLRQMVDDEEERERANLT